MKRRVALLLALLLTLLCSAAHAEAPGLSDALYGQAKEALSRLSYGDYGQISAVLTWAGVAPSAQDWAALAGRFSTLNVGTVQRDISVAYWTGDGWHIAVPVTEPRSDRVEALVLVSADGQSFSGFAYAQWGAVRSAYDASDAVAWNREYVESVPILISDD